MTTTMTNPPKPRPPKRNWRTTPLRPAAPAPRGSSADLPTRLVGKPKPAGALVIVGTGQDEVRVRWCPPRPGQPTTTWKCDRHGWGRAPHCPCSLAAHAALRDYIDTTENR